METSEAGQWPPKKARLAGGEGMKRCSHEQGCGVPAEVKPWNKHREQKGTLYVCSSGLNFSRFYLLGGE